MKKVSAAITFTVLIMTLLAVMPASAANGRQAQIQGMTDIEYHYQLIPTGVLTAGSDTLSSEFLAQTAFIEWKNEPAYKEGFYIDTVDRFLKKHAKVLRVRFDLRKPKKSKVTLKSRSTDIKELDFMGHEPGGEIDAFFGNESYSFSVDTPLPQGQFDVTAMSPADVFAFLKSENSELYALTQGLRDQPSASIIKTAVMRMAKFKGAVRQGEHEGMKVELQVWTVKGTNRAILAEIGFDGSTAERNILDVQDKWLSGELKARKLLAKDPGASKTEITFTITGKQ